MKLKEIVPVFFFLLYENILLKSKIVNLTYCLNKGGPPSKTKYITWMIVYEYCEGKMK